MKYAFFLLTYYFVYFILNIHYILYSLLTVQISYIFFKQTI